MEETGLIRIMSVKNVEEAEIVEVTTAGEELQQRKVTLLRVTYGANVPSSALQI